ncbi:MAG: FUSC family protein [Nocardioidaceae bacterium]
MVRSSARVGEALADPATQTDLLQVVKAVLASVGAWLLAVHVFGLREAFLAPWVALLTVQATLYRTFWRGAQSVLATGLGIALAFVVAEAFGAAAWSLGIALLVGLLLARAGVLRQEGVTVATTALFVLTTGYEHQQEMLLDRFLDTAIGVAVGVVANLVIFPPLNDRSAERQVDLINRSFGDLLSRMAVELGSTSRWEAPEVWIERTRELDRDLDHAWQLVRHASESSWWNPRRRLSRRAGDPTLYEHVLHRLEEGLAQTRSMARTVHDSTRAGQEWDPRFSAPWLHLLGETGRRVRDPDADVSALRPRIEDLTWKLSLEELPGLNWSTYGALISNLSHVVNVVDDVATSRPVRT